MDVFFFLRWNEIAFKQLRLLWHSFSRQHYRHHNKRRLSDVDYGVNIRLRKVNSRGRGGVTPPLHSDQIPILLKYSRLRWALSRGVPMPGRTSCSTTIQPS